MFLADHEIKLDSMEQPKRLETDKKSNLLKTILFSGLLVGTFDITAATIQVLLYGRDPINMYKFIASGVFGQASLTGGSSYAVLGFVFHYCIAYTWTTFFFLMYPKLKFLSKNKIITGIGYGLFVWLIMNRIVLPLSNTPSFPFRLTSALIGASILIIAIGLPLSFIAKRFYGSR